MFRASFLKLKSINKQTKEGSLTDTQCIATRFEFGIKFGEIAQFVQFAVQSYSFFALRFSFAVHCNVK